MGRTASDLDDRFAAADAQGSLTKQLWDKLGGQEQFDITWGSAMRRYKTREPLDAAPQTLTDARVRRPRCPTRTTARARAPRCRRARRGTRRPSSGPTPTACADKFGDWRAEVEDAEGSAGRHFGTN